MRHLIPLIYLLIAALPTWATVSTVDSLRSALSKTTHPAEQMRLLQDLADVAFETQEACGYLNKIVEIAKQQNDTQRSMEALTDIAFTHIALDQIDSVRHYIRIMEQQAPTEQSDQWCCYPRMRLFAVELLGEGSKDAVAERIENFRTQSTNKQSPYKQIETEYALGTALYNDGKHQDAVPYLTRALDVAQKLPIHEGATYQLLILRQLTRVYNILKQSQLAIKSIHSSIEIKEEFYNLYDKPRRPFYPIDDFYITQYSTMMINIDVLPEVEIQFIIGRIKQMLGRVKQPHARYSCFLTLNNYHTNRRDYRRALSYNDSLIFYARKIAHYNLPGLYSVSSQINELLSQPAEALVYLKESYRLRDSLSRENENTQLNKLRVEYDLNRLNYENSQLAIRNKQTMLIGLLLILALVLALCVYLYNSLRRERKFKQRMQQLKLLAEESEKLKTAFINSLCHEIRTPLNNIVGFSELLLDNSVDSNERESFPKIIRQNTELLTTQINSMLEVSNLEVSNEPLPCQSVDVVALCRSAAKNLFESHDNENVKGQIEISSGHLMIETNQRYLWLVLDNLMDNAFKFTDRGTVKIECHCADKKVVIAISDTGCGIPTDKHKAVFDRFTKLNTYKDGTGLGLYICKRIVGRLQGKIYIDPQYNSGTRVVVELPLK